MSLATGLACSAVCTTLHSTPLSFGSGCCFEEDWELEEGDEGGGGPPPDKPDPKVDERLKGLEAGIAAERKARQEAEARLKSFEEAEAKKRGEYEGLYKEASEKLSDYEKRLKTYEEKENARLERISKGNEEKVKKLSAEHRDLVPAISDPEALGEWLDKFSSRLPEPPKGGNVAGKGSSTEEIPADIAAEAQRRGITPETLWAIEKKRRGKKG